MNVVLKTLGSGFLTGFSMAFGQYFGNKVIDKAEEIKAEMEELQSRQKAVADILEKHPTIN